MAFSFFGISDDGLGLYVNLLALFLVGLWIALIAWTYWDAKRRIEDPVLIRCATAASLYPYVGTLVYAILRPPKLLSEAHERELEIRVSTLRLKQLEEEVCPNCEHPIRRTYRRCPNCRTRVKEACRSCGKPVEPGWSLCPYCETAVQPVAAAGRPFASSPWARTSLPEFETADPITVVDARPVQPLDRGRRRQRVGQIRRRSRDVDQGLWDDE